MAYAFCALFVTVTVSRQYCIILKKSFKSAYIQYYEATVTAFEISAFLCFSSSIIITEGIFNDHYFFLSWGIVKRRYQLVIPDRFL